MTAPTLVLIPGLLNDATVWQAQKSELSRQASITIARRAGHETSLEAMAHTVLSEAGGPIALAGHSMGGRVALEVCRLAPQRVVGLALFDTGFLPLPAGERGEMELQGRQSLLRMSIDYGMRHMLKEWVQGMVAKDRLDDGPLIGAIIDMMAKSTPEDFRHQIDALLGRPDASAVLRSFRCPALAACGVLDAWSPPAQHQQMAAMLHDSELVVIPDCGHMAPMEKPQAVTQALMDWWLRVIRQQPT
jgi:pimeloyl-ACP methyl ester carboxylesterase